MVSDVIYYYERDVKELQFLFATSAMESELDNNNDGDTSPVDKTSLLDTLKKIIDTIIATIQRMLSRIGVLFKKAMVTDQGFQTELRKAEINTKPLKGVELFLYNYNSNWLNSQFQIVHQFIQKELQTAMDTKDDPDQKVLSKDDLVKELLDLLKVPSNVANFSIYFPYARDTFRGKKTQRTVMGTEIPKYRKIAESYKETQRSLNQKMEALKLDVTKVQRQVRQQIQQTDTQKEEKRKVMHRVRKLSTIITIYNSFCELYFDLKVEEMLHARIILKKLYQF